ncbi:uncharacterized protein LOC132166788 isoform X2 [Corylus avellana]|uniref:uncharacterized protein LOC132166788 isoform X2 n=1 Tax=Corylus avellana TaxID=13451 RepID=UPI001E210EA2|nr:uncharacterized protein LOC132166788 isoform X2 [Corylus avellana]
MAESKPDPTTQSLSDKEVKAPNLFERAKEEIEAILHSEKSPHHHKETHGKRNDIDENTPLDDVRAPNVFERAKEEFEALVEAIHPKKESPNHERRDETTKTQSKQSEADSLSENNVKEPNFIDRTKKKIEAITHHHHKETHGNIDEKTPIYDVKAPNVFERAKEEIEAVIESVHPKKERGDSVSSPHKEGGFGFSIGRTLEKVCSRQDSVRD